MARWLSWTRLHMCLIVNAKKSPSASTVGLLIYKIKHKHLQVQWLKKKKYTCELCNCALKRIQVSIGLNNNWCLIHRDLLLLTITLSSTVGQTHPASQARFGCGRGRVSNMGVKAVIVCTLVLTCVPKRAPYLQFEYQAMPPITPPTNSKPPWKPMGQNSFLDQICTFDTPAL